MIYDTFLFHSEFELLDIRLHELGDVVDKFVLVESTKTFKGDDKPLYFDENKYLFKDYLDKIIHVTILDSPDFDPDDKVPGESGGGIDRFQRNCVMRGLTGCNDNDVIIIADADEIVRREVLKNISLTDRRIYNMRFRLYYYYLNTYFERFWREVCILKYSKLKTFPFPHAIKLGYRRWRPIDGDCGWHFSYLGSAEKVKEKINWYWYIDTPAINNIDNIQDCIKNLRSVNPYSHLRGQTMKIDDISYLPKYVQDNQDKFKPYFWTDNG